MNSELAMKLCFFWIIIEIRKIISSSRLTNRKCTQPKMKVTWWLRQVLQVSTIKTPSMEIYYLNSWKTYHLMTMMTTSKICVQKFILSELMSLTVFPSGSLRTKICWGVNAFTRRRKSIWDQEPNIAKRTRKSSFAPRLLAMKTEKK